MPNAPTTIRQAALVLARLDRDARDAVLEEMPAEQAEKIRCLLLNLDADSEVEQAAAIRQFLATQPYPLAPQIHAESRAFELDGDDPDGMVAPMVHPSSAVDNLTSSLHDLLQHTDRVLADVLRLERPTTVAALLSALPGGRAAAILRLHPPELRAKVLMLLNSGMDPHPQATEAISEWICDYLAERSVEPIASLRHQDAIQAILDEFHPEEREAMLEELAQENPLLARRLATSPTKDAEPAHDCYC